jgi:DNA-binding response OmpR family regulator
MQTFVLIAEDDPAIRRLLTAVLKKQGIASVAVEDGRQALERAANGTFDALLLDLMMPNLSGWTVLEQLTLRGSPLAKKVVVITAAGDADVQRLPPGTRVLRKPFDLDLVVATVRAVLGLQPLSGTAAEKAAGSRDGVRA